MGRDLAVQNFGSVEAKRKYAAGIHSALADISDYEGTPILKLGDDGEWTFGPENIFLDDKDVLAVNPRSIRHGYIAFDQKSNSLAETIDGEPAEVIVPITEALYFEDLPELETPKRGEPPVWRKQIIVEMMIVAGPNKGESLVYKPTSQGGRRVLAKLAREIAHRLEDESENIVPVIQLFSSTYFNKRFSRDVVTPEMSIDQWLPLDATSVSEGAEKRTKDDDNSVDVDEEAGESRKARRRGGRDATNAPKADRRSGRRAEPEPADEDEDDEQDEQPRGRGRRAATRDTRADDGRGERRGRATRDEEPDDEDDEQDEPRGRARRNRAADEDARTRADERRGRRSRDDEEDTDDDDLDRRGANRRRASTAARGGRDGARGERGRDRDDRAPARGNRRSRDAADDRGSEDGVRGRRAASGSRSSGRDVPAREDRSGRRAA